jgi:DNA-3-methyladenine glycosylase
VAASIINKKFYAQNTLLVARKLLGKKLVREIDGAMFSGMIVETEAYCGEDDSACHAHRGKTHRNAVMFGHPGHAYVYFTYGMHYMLNLVTESEGNPCAVLLRGILPIAGIEEMQARRKKKGTELVNGPAKLCQALCIDKSLNGWDLTLGKELWVENYKTIPARSVVTTPRIGIDYAKTEHREAQWRFVVTAIKEKTSIACLPSGMAVKRKSGECRMKMDTG